mgnify:CR=1 FL=1
MPLKIIVLVVVAVVVLGSVCVVILWGSRWRQAAVVTADSLNYPCLRIIDGHAWERIDRPGDLDQINSNRSMNRREDPLVVDSSFRVFEMTEFTMKASAISSQHHQNSMIRSMSISGIQRQIMHLPQIAQIGI